MSIHNVSSVRCEESKGGYLCTLVKNKYTKEDVSVDSVKLGGKEPDDIEVTAKFTRDTECNVRNSELRCSGLLERSTGLK